MGLTTFNPSALDVIVARVQNQSTGRTLEGKKETEDLVPRTRQLKHDFFLNENLAALDPLARLLFAGLWVLVDREGRLEDRPAKIKAQLFPYHDADVDKFLGVLDAARFIIRYEVGGQRFLQVKKFAKHQHIHPDEKQSTFPAYVEIPGNPRKSPEIMPYSSSSSPSLSSSTSNGAKAPKPKPKKHFEQPTPAQVSDYANTIGFDLDGNRFCDYYEMRGWKLATGKPLVSWEAAVRTWKNNNSNNQQPRPQSNGEYPRILHGRTVNNQEEEFAENRRFTAARIAAQKAG